MIYIVKERLLDAVISVFSLITAYQQLSDQVIHCGRLLCRDASFKEVIQPQVPLRLPCYDFTPVMNHTVVIALLR